MADFSHLKKKYDVAKAEANKAQLEKEMADFQNATRDISLISEELNYATDLFNKISFLNKKIDEYQETNTLANDTSDTTMAEMAQSELPQIEETINSLEEEITQMKIEKELQDPDDLKSVILEIRAGAGGEEAALFAADLFRMYTQFATTHGLQVEVADSSPSESGGYKDAIVNIKGKNAYKMLKYESGVHRVQRIPSTESAGRIHTSTASVAIMPEAKDIDIQINPEDLRIDVMRASGPGGQSVNRTDSAVRITHLPTGIVVSCQETKEQHKNKEKAMNILRTRLYEKKRQEEHAKRSDLRAKQIGTGMRAEKIRTYNYPQSRITDHRIKESWHNLEGIMAGDMTDMIETISKEMQKLQLEALNKTL